MGLFKLGGEVLAFFLVDRTGRRPLFIVSSTLVTVFLFILGEWVLFFAVCVCVFLFLHSEQCALSCFVFRLYMLWCIMLQLPFRNAAVHFILFFK